MAHLTDDELMAYAFDPAAVANRMAIDAHLASCASCAAEIDELRAGEKELADPITWAITEQDDRNRDSLRELAAQAATEDSAAELLLADLIASPVRAAWANLAQRRKYHTAGVVRRLLIAAHDACEREPLDALTLADAAIDVAERLTAYASTTVYELRGHAWKERAIALAALGRYDASLEALHHAEREFRHLPGAPLGPAMVQHARAIVYYERGELARARDLLSESAATYNALGEAELYARARHYLGNVLYRQQDVRGAQQIYEESLAWGENENDLRWVAHAHRVLGHCAYQLGNFTAASMHFHLSAKQCRELGLGAELTRTEWGFALVLLGTGKYEEALEAFKAVRDDFHRRDMLTDAALVALSMMEALHALGRFREIVALATEVAQTFTAAGMITSALTAFAYLKEAARDGTITTVKISRVRDFVRRLEREPAIIFSPDDNHD